MKGCARWYCVPSSWALFRSLKEFLWPREKRDEVDKDAVTVWSTRNRTRCWGSGEKKYLNTRNATVIKGVGKAALGKCWLRNHSWGAPQATAPNGREDGSDARQEVIWAGKASPGVSQGWTVGDTQTQGRLSLGAMHQALVRVCASMCVCMCVLAYG